MAQERVPFPQANDMNKIYQILEYAYWHEGVDKYDINKVFHIMARQGDYYLNALAFLGLLVKINKRFMITDLGKSIMQAPLYSRFIEFRRVLLCNDIVNTVYHILNTEGDLNNYLKIYTSKIADLHNLPLTTAKRRINTIVSWVRWIKLGEQESCRFEDHLLNEI